MTTWLTPVAVSERTSFAVKTLANWRSLGTGPAFRKVGHLVRYDAETLDKWMDEQPEME